MARKKGIFIPHEFARSVWRLSDEDAGLLLKACFDYCEGFTEAEVADCIKDVWAELRSSLEEEARRYEAKCSKYRYNATKRWNGKDAMAMQWQCNGINKETERENEKEKRTKEKEKEKGKEDEKENNTKESEATQEVLLAGQEEQDGLQYQNDKKVESQEDRVVRPAGYAEGGPRFKKPSLAEVAEYIKANGYDHLVDAEAFWNFYESKDWMIGKNKMKKWQSAVITWVRGRKQSQPMSRGNGTSMADRAYNMLHFEYENTPEKWKEEAKKMEELQKYQ